MKTSTSISDILNQITGPDSPGFQYIIADKNSVINQISTGLANISSGTPLSLKHTMSAFSMTKVLTAIAVFQLVEKNKIELEDALKDYVNHPFSPMITIRHLLNHTAGLPNPIPLKWVHLAENHEYFNEQNTFELILKKHSNYIEPGLKFKYSNIGYWLLGKLIEEVSQKKFTKYVTEQIFEPLRLTPDKIGFVIYDLKMHAKGYLKRWSVMNLMARFLIDKKVMGDYENGWLHIKNVYVNGPSFGGAIGSAAAFNHIQNDLIMDDSKLLGPISKQLLFTQQRLKNGYKIKMALGYHIGETNGFTYFYKKGGGAGFNSEMRIYPEIGISSVLTANRTSFNSSKVLNSLDSRVVTNYNTLLS